MYKNILSRQIAEFNSNYKKIFKMFPSLSVTEKRRKSYVKMISDRGFDEDSVLIDNINPVKDSKGFQWRLECYLTYIEVYGGIDRYYVKEESLFDFFKNTEVKKKEIKSILEMMKLHNELFVCGVLGKEQAYTIACTDYRGLHIVTVLTDDMNYTFCIEQFNDAKFSWVFNLSMNFIFYINAFPECVIDGVPEGVKKIEKGRTVSISNKIVSHTCTDTERGFVRPHFRTGYFRHFNSDYFVNCKGQVRFIPSTMVKGNAKTVISKHKEE